MYSPCLFFIVTERKTRCWGHNEGNGRQLSKTDNWVQEEEWWNWRMREHGNHLPQTVTSFYETIISCFGFQLNMHNISFPLSTDFGLES